MSHRAVFVANDGGRGRATSGGDEVLDVARVRNGDRLPFAHLVQTDLDLEQTDLAKSVYVRKFDLGP